MAIKQMLSARLSPDLINEIQILAASKKTDVDTLLTLAIDALKRDENTPVSVAERVEIFEKTLSDRMQQVEQNMLRLIGVMAPILPLVTEVEDRTFRTWGNSQMTLAWANIVVDSGGMPTKTEWEKLSMAIKNKIEKERSEIIDSRKNAKRSQQ